MSVGAVSLKKKVADKNDINDVRDSPALSIIERLRPKGANVRYHDPFVGEVRVEDDELQSVTLTNDELRSSECVVIVTDHSEIDYKRVCSLAPLIVDTRIFFFKQKTAYEM